MTQTKAELLQTRHQGDIRLGDANSSHYVGFKAPATVGTSLVWTLPAADGTANYLLKTDGSGNLGWVADSTTDSTKMPLAGGTFTGDVTFQGAANNVVWDKSDNALEFADSAKAIFGGGGDLQIYANGSNSIIAHNGDGNLQLTTGASGEDILLQAYGDIDLKPNNGNNGVKIIGGGAVSLYFNGGKKFETDTNGVTITGTTTCNGDVHFDGNTAGRDALWDRSDNCLLFQDDAYLKIGTGADLQIYHDGSSSTIYENGTGPLNIQTNNSNINIKGGGSAAHNMAIFKSTEGVELYYNDVKTFETKSNGVIVQGTEGQNAELLLYADEGDDDADKWRIKSDTAGSFEISNYASGGYEKNIECNGNGNVELYYNNVKKLETDGNGINVIDDDSTVEVSLTDSNGAAGHVYGTSSSGLIALLVGNGETSVAGYQNGATQLFHDNNKKLETSSSGVTVTGTVSDSIGELRQIPQRSVSSVTLAASDVGKAVLATSTVTVPNGVFSSGDAVTIINNSGSDITISKGISTMYLASDGSSANRTLATRGMATIWFSSSSVAYISGAGLS